MLARETLCLLILAIASASSAAAQVVHGERYIFRRELEALYAQNASAFMNQFDAIMALRAPGFHAVMPDGAVRDRAEMETYTRGFLNGVKKWNRLTFTIDSLRVPLNREHLASAASAALAWR